MRCRWRIRSQEEPKKQHSGRVGAIPGDKQGNTRVYRTPTRGPLRGRTSGDGPWEGTGTQALGEGPCFHCIAFCNLHCLTDFTNDERAVN